MAPWQLHIPTALRCAGQRRRAVRPAEQSGATCFDGPHRFRIHQRAGHHRVDARAVDDGAHTQFFQEVALRRRSLSEAGQSVQDWQAGKHLQKRSSV